MTNRKTYTFPVVAWDDAEGKDVWIGDITSQHDDPLLARYENEEAIAKLAAEIGNDPSGVYVVREIK